MIRAFFFDLDGTLVDTYEADFLAYRQAISEVAGVEILKEDFYRTHGMEMADKLRILTPELSEGRYPEVRNGKKLHYKKFVSITKANEGLVRFLAQFSRHQECVLVTSAKRDNALSVLDHHGLKEYFSLLICGDDIVNPKPDPEPYLLALDRTGLMPGEVLAFEDSEAGFESAEKAGIAVVQVREFSDHDT
jgi:beta-phosphoglucomutase